MLGCWVGTERVGRSLEYLELPTPISTLLCLQLAAPEAKKDVQNGEGRRVGRRPSAPAREPHLQVKTSVRSLHVLHLTKQHQWNLQLHCHTLVYWCVL